MSDNPPPKQKKLEYKPIRYFVSPLNTYFGNILVETLRNDKDHPQDPNLIVGTASRESSKYGISSAVRKVIDPTKLTFLSKVFLDSDVIIYDLTTCDHDEAEYAIKTLKMGDYKENKILIFLSSVMVWSATPPKVKKEGEEIDEADQEDPDSEPEPDDQKEPKDDDDEQVVKKEYVRFTEADYTRRKPLPQFEALKALETMCLSAGNSKPQLLSFVLSAGILYGMGEQVFYNHFKQAWLQNPKALSFYGDGKNRLPCIHVKDLATFVLKIAERPPTMKYIFAIDHNKKPIQKKIILAISKGIGTGEIQQEPATQNDVNFTLDVRMRPTKAFDAFIEEAANQDDQVEEGEEPPPKYTFPWECKEGIQKNIEKINKEFNDFNKLQPIRIFVTGPPAVGKTYWAQAFAAYYNLPHILIKDVASAFIGQKTEEAESLQASLEELRTQMIEEAQQAYEIEKKKRKALGLPVIPFDENLIKPRLNDQQLQMAFKWRLMQNDCQNRGYVLDGFPKTYENARGVFLMPEKSGDEDGGGDDENKPLILNQKINPHHVIILNADDKYLIQRVANLKEDDVKGTHYNEKDMSRRLNLYRSINQTGKGVPILIDFFKEQKIDTISLNVTNNQNKIFNQCQSFIERNGLYNNYYDHEGEKEKQRLTQEKQKMEQLTSNQQKQQVQRDKEELDLWKLQEEEYKIKQDHSRNYERELLDSRSQPLRQYLNDNVVPFITEGLIELVKQTPGDPVDFLAEFLFKRSLHVQFPDPGKYFERMNEK